MNSTAHRILTPPTSSQNRLYTTTAPLLLTLSSQSEAGKEGAVKSDDFYRERIVTRAMLMPTLRDYIAFGIGSIPEVLAVFTSQQGEIFYVWTVVDQSDPTVRRKIYEKEKSIINSFGTFDFDFSVLAAKGRAPRQVVGDTNMELAYLRS